ncbi:MAG TPA: GNAT family N-acetyltransferase [Acidimicrobiales bacterium]|nr:GNAT family N-acetyltransferase [Acidimicrobiales bacterium]
MRTARCFCPFVGEADDPDELVRIMTAHFAEAHPEAGIGEVAVRNYVEAQDRLHPAGDRVPAIGAVEVHQVTPDRIDDWLAFFDHDAFAGKPEWAACYCLFPHRWDPTDPSSWGNTPWEENRAEMIERLRRGDTTGYLAYVDGRPVGWVNASPVSTYPAFRREGAERVAGVACFVIAPAYRRHGVARRLLDAAIEGAARDGFEAIEGRPRKGASDEADNFPGPIELYLAAGFEAVEQTDAWTLMRKPTISG